MIGPKAGPMTARPALAVAISVLSAALAAGAPAVAHAERALSYDEPGTYPVQVVDVVWRDESRQRDLPLRIRLPDAPGLRPLVIFSHGLGGSIEGGRAWGKHWASYGLAVIHVQHPGSDQSLWQDSNNPARDLRHAADLAQFVARVADVKFILDELQRRQARGDPIASRVDLGRVGMSGHSFGAITTQALAGQTYKVARARQAAADMLREPRFAAFVAFSPSARKASDSQQFSAITHPFLSVTGSDDGKVGAGLGVPPELRRVPYSGMPPGDKYLLVLNGADHMIFNGGGRTEGRLARSAPPDPARDAQIERVTRATTTAFWLAYLADDAPARQWLGKVGSTIGEAGTFTSK